MTCPELYDPDNGRVMITGSTYGSVAIYSCEPGYELVGDETRSCEEDGTWSGDEPTCEGNLKLFEA